MNLLNRKFVFQYRVGILRDGKAIWKTDFKKNLILDCGLDKIASVPSAGCFSFCLFGNQVSPDPVARNSGAITFTTVGTACTASAGFFIASDVGRLIKFDDGSGQERYITGYTSATLVTLGSAPSPAIAAVTATVWYVNQTALQSLYSTTSTYRSGGAFNGTSWSGAVRTMKRTYIGAAVAGSVTLTEIGFSNSATNVNIFDRDIIVGGIGLVTGDQPMAEANLIETYSPTTATAAGNVATGFDSSGTYQYCDATSGLTAVDSTGNVVGNASVEPAGNNYIGMYMQGATYSLPAFNTLSPPGTAYAPSGGSVGGYTPGSFFKDWTTDYSTAYVSTVYGFSLVSSGATSRCWSILLTTPFAKTALQTLSVTIRFNWQRILFN